MALHHPRMGPAVNSSSVNLSGVKSIWGLNVLPLLSQRLNVIVTRCVLWVWLFCCFVWPWPRTVCNRSRWSSGVNGGSGGGGSSGGAGGGGAGGGSSGGGGGGGSGAGGGGSGSTSGRSSTAARDSRRQTRVIRTGRDRGSGLLGSQPQPVIPASVIPEELITQVRYSPPRKQTDLKSPIFIMFVFGNECYWRACFALNFLFIPLGSGSSAGEIKKCHHQGTPED